MTNTLFKFLTHAKSIMSFMIFLIFTFFILANVPISILSAQINTELTPQSKLPPSCYKILNDFNIAITKFSAQELDRAGLKLLSGKSYYEALELFRCALILDFNYTSSHYNRAKVLSILHENGLSADIELLFFHLRRALALDPFRIKILGNDASFVSVRSLDQYTTMLLDYPVKKISSIYYQKDFMLAGAWIDPKEKLLYDFTLNGIVKIISLSDTTEKTFFWVYDSAITKKILKNNKHTIFLLDSHDDKITSKTRFLSIESFNYYSVEIGSSTWFKTDSPIIKAIKDNDTAVLRSLFSSGININILQCNSSTRSIENLNSTPYNFEINTPLFFACKYSNLEAIKTMLAYGAYISPDELLVLIEKTNSIEFKKSLLNYFDTIGFGIKTPRINKKIYVASKEVHYSYDENYDHFDTIMGKIAVTENDILPTSLKETYSFSSNSNYMAYIGNFENGIDLFLLDIEGNLLRLTGHGEINWLSSCFDSSISWSSDGKMFTLSVNGSLWLYSTEQKSFAKISFPEEGWFDIKPYFINEKIIQFYRGTIVEFSFTGNEYEYNLETSQTYKISEEILYLIME